MQRIAWTTDLHLNFVAYSQRMSFLRDIKSLAPDGVLIGGDISEADDVVWQLQQICGELDLPVYFVLGNHDFYQGSFTGVRAAARAACEQNPKLHYLTGASPVELGSWVLVGDDCPADGRSGDALSSPIQMNDFRLIGDFHGLSIDDRLRLMRREGAAAAVRLGRQLAAAASISQNILLLSHCPPAREACWYEGRLSDGDWAPYFVCESAGWQLQRFCRAHPEHQVVVLCGHTHSPGKTRLLPNLVVWTASAEYGNPEVSACIPLDVSAPATVAQWSFDLDLTAVEQAAPDASI